MSEQKPKRPQIHLGEEAPVSPYVIDLSRPARAIAPRTSLDHARAILEQSGDLRRMEALPLPVVQAMDDLLLHQEDLQGQLSEQDFTPSWAPEVAEPMLDRSAGDIFAEFRASSLQDAFTAMDLPVLEHDDAFADEAEVVELSVSSFEPFTVAQPVEEPARTVRQAHHGWQKAIAAFVGLSFLFVLPIHAMQQIEQAKSNGAKIQAAGLSALNSFSKGASALQQNDFSLAANDFASANQNFTTAQAKLNQLSGTVSAILSTLPQTQGAYASGSALVSAGQSLTKSAQLFASALDDMKNTTTDSPVVKLDILSAYLEKMEPLLTDATNELKAVDVHSLPSSQQASVQLVIDSTPTLAEAVSTFLQFNHSLRQLIGGDGAMRYLVLFQNNAEMRPTGGFIGSYADITLDNGKIVNVDIPGGGSYDLEGQLSLFENAPAPMQLLRARWEFQDTNWFPDFPTSAQTLLNFYSHAGGPTVDGVIAINASFFADLLKILGPVDMPSYGKTITSDNFLNTTQKIVEQDYDKTTNKPKQFIADLAPTVLDRVQSADAGDFVSILERLSEGLAERDIQLYFQNADLMKTITDLGWSGAVTQTSGDSLMVIDTNLGGGKTDLVIKESVDAQVDIQDDGSIIDTVTVTRTHNGTSGDPFTGVNNVDYQRVYVPAGSTLVSASGDFAPPAATLFKTSDVALGDDATLSAVTGAVSTDAASGTAINEEFGKTVFGNWVQTKPGATSTVRYVYRLPFTVDALAHTPSFMDQVKGFLGLSDTGTYTLFVQKQSGEETRETHVTVNVPDNASKIWASDDSLTKDGLSTDGMTDGYAALLLQRHDAL